MTSFAKEAFARAKVTATRAKDIVENQLKDEPSIASLRATAGRLGDATKKKFDKNRDAIMQSAVGQLELKIARFMNHLYATKLKPEITCDKWMPEAYLQHGQSGRPSGVTAGHHGLL